MAHKLHSCIQLYLYDYYVSYLLILRLGIVINKIVNRTHISEILISKYFVCRVPSSVRDRSIISPAIF